MGSYTQLTEPERYQIKALLSAGHKKTEIATILGRHKTTISREIKCQVKSRLIQIKTIDQVIFWY